MLRLPPFEYHRPSTVGEAIALLEQHGADAMLIAGGTDVIPNMKHRLHEPDHLVSIRRIRELRGVDERDGEIVIGAGETLAVIAADPRVGRLLPALAEAAGQVAGPQLRNVGTIGGNLCLDTRCTYYNQSYFWRRSLGFCLKKDGDRCHVTGVGKKCVAAHSADTPPVLWVLGGRVELLSPRGARMVPVDEFFVADGVRNTIRAEDEVLTRVIVPVPDEGTRAGYHKVRPRRAIDFPALGLAAALSVDDGRLRALRLVVSALGSRPREVTGLEELAGRPVDDELLDDVAERAHQQCRPLTNMIVDPEWRRAMVPVYTRRLLERLRAPASGSDGR